MDHLKHFLELSMPLLGLSVWFIQGLSKVVEVILKTTQGVWGSGKVEVQVNNWVIKYDAAKKEDRDEKKIGS